MEAERLRWAIFTSSVVSSVDNPEAHLWRAIGLQLSQRGQHATFFEERGNPPIRALLRQSGARALLEFRERFPDIQYRTLDVRSGFDLAEWLMRTLSTIDIAVVQHDAPGELIAILGQFTRPYLQTFLVDSGWNRGSSPVLHEQTTLAGLTGVLVADESLAEAYGQDIPAQRIHRIGPLPETIPGADPFRESSGSLEDGATRIIDTIMTISVRIRRARGAQMLPNGRTDQVDGVTTHEAD